MALLRLFHHWSGSTSARVASKLQRRDLSAARLDRVFYTKYANYPEIAATMAVAPVACRYNWMAVECVDSIDPT